MEFEKIMKLEALISAEVKKDNINALNFNYQNGTADPLSDGSGITWSDNVKVKVSVFTFNGKTGEFFLLMSAVTIDAISALEQILAYVTTHKDTMSPYTVSWSRKSDGTSIYESYFYCKNIKTAIEKFYTGKDENMYTIYSIKLNPIS